MKVECNEGVNLLLRAFAMAAYPNEGCGVLIGELSSEKINIVDVTVGRNMWTERSRDRYDLDPRDILGAERAAAERGLDVVGFWHSHPNHPAQPSQFDSERAWLDYAYLICATTIEGSQLLNPFMVATEGGPLEPVPMHVTQTASL